MKAIAARRRRAHRPPRAAVVFRRFGPYHVARLGAAGQALEVFGVEFTRQDTVYAWDHVADSQGFTRLTVLDRFRGSLRERLRGRRRLGAALDRIRPDVVVVSGWASTEALAALSWSLGRGTRTVLMSESTAGDAPRSAWREQVKRRLVGCYDAALVGGTPQRDYLLDLGMPGSRISVGYDVVDNDHFARGAQAARARGDEARLAHGLPPRYFLASARFVEKKNLERLLEAYARYRTVAMSRGGQGGEPWGLVLLGDGPLRARLEARRRDLGLEGAVVMPGFRQYEELPLFYGLGAAFVLPSAVEPWGLVVNEAMASGLPVLVSARCGCAADLVRPGRNGFTFDPHDPEALAHLMAEVAGSRLDRRAMGEASLELIAGWGPARFARGLSDAVRTALAAGEKAMRPAGRMLAPLLALR